MKKMSSLFCVMCLVLTGIWVLPVFGEDEQNSNNDVQPMGSRSILWVGSGQTYSNIQDAINVSKNGDTIRVTNGTFNQNLLINKSITIIGNGYYNTVVNGQGFAPVAKIVANWVNISGMQFTNNDVYSYPGIVIDKSDNCKIEDCNITGNSDGIEVLSSNNTIITNIEVDSNTFRGITLYYSNNNIISRCYIKSNYESIIINNSNKNSIKQNDIYGNTYGIYIMAYSCNNTIENNKITGQSNLGLSISDITCIDNMIHLNNFFNNNGGGKQAGDDSTNNSWNNPKYGNYWRDWNSPDNDNDKIVDNPYSLLGTGGAKDNYPLLHPTYYDAPPHIKTTNNLFTFASYPYSVHYKATDQDTPDDELTWTWSTNASWLSFSANQHLSGTPQMSDLGTYWVWINVSDGKFIDSRNFWIKVLIPPTSRAVIVRTGQKYLKIQDAIDNATSGDTIRIWAGTYYENVTLDKKLNLIGNGSTQTIINGGNYGSVITIKANGCKVTDLQTIGSVTLNPVDAGIELYDVENCYLANNTCSGKTYGIFLYYSDDNEIENCTCFQNKYAGINISGSYLKSADNNRISNCTLNWNDLGIDLCRSDGNTIINNECNWNDWFGISLGMGSGSENNLIAYNLIKENKGYGIFAGSWVNYIYLNSFIDNGNGVQAYDSYNLNRWNQSKGNYWNDWTSPDSNGDGIVDNPYTLNGSYGNKDFKPLVNATYTKGPPMLVTTNVHNAFVGKPYSVQYTAYDPDTQQNQLVWTLHTNASWLSLSSSQVLTGTPISSDIGVYWVQVNVSDGDSTDKTFFHITVMAFGLPTIITSNVTIAYVGESYYVHYNATDPDTPKQSLIWSFNTNASWLNFSSSQVLSGTPTTSDIGEYWVYIAVSDGNASDSTNFTITVQKKVVPPPPPPPPPSNGSVILVRTNQRFKKIQDAVNTAISGDNIRVYSGVYYENIAVNKTLSIIGNGSSQSIINGSYKDSVVTIDADGCQISGFSITGSHIKSDLYASSGILIDRCSNNKIIDCNFYGNGWGISLMVSNNNKIQDCTFNLNRWTGINMSSSDDNDILHCNSSFNNAGISLSSSDGNRIENCTYSFNTADGIGIGDSKANIIKYNTVMNNKYWGISLYSCDDHSIYLNNFINNNIGVPQASDSSQLGNNQWNTTNKGNYWSEWTKPDKNNDGIVDKPYNLSSSTGVKDYYPLVRMVGQAPPPPSSAPVITTQDIDIAYVNETYSVNYAAIDADTPLNQLIWSMKTNATWLSFSGTRLSGTPSISDIGNYWVNISVSDGLHTAAANFTITVKTRQAPPPPNNTSPKIDSTSVDNYRNNVSVNNSEIIIKFSKPMNRSSVESALSVSTNVEYTLEWNNDSTELKIIFKDKLDYNTTYNITIDPTAKDIYGNYLSSPFKLFFTTEAESNLDGNEGKPDNDFKPEENVGVLALIIIILLLIIVLMVFAVFVLSRRNKKMEPQSDPKDLESRIVPASDSASGSIADEFDFESSSSKESDEYVMKLLNEARAAKKPSDFDIRKEEMLYKIERKYSKGEISKNTYNSIRDLLEDYKIY